MSKEMPAGGSSWPEIAQWYDRLLESGSGPHETAVASLLRLLPDVAGATVLDVACGTGIAARAVAEAGAAAVIGVDAAEPMVELARGRTAPTVPVTYVVDDAQSLDRFADGSVDGAVCQLGLMDIPDLGAALAAVRRALRPGGWFVFVIGHPCFLSPHATTLTVDGRLGRFVSDYVTETFWRSDNPGGIRGKVGNHHRSVATYLNAVLDAGFIIERVEEPMAGSRLAEEQPVYEQLPIFLAARVIRR